MSFLMTLGLAVLGVVLAAAVVRAALTGAAAPSFGRAVAVVAVALLVATGLANAGDTFRLLRDKRAEWAPKSTKELVEAGAGEAGVDVDFAKWAKSHLLRGQKVYFQKSMGDAARLWLTYRVAPIIVEDDPDEADWLLYWQDERGPTALGISEAMIEHHAVYAEGVGLVKVRREG